MLIQSAQSMTFGASTDEKTVVLKSSMPYSGIRITFQHVASSGVLNDTTGGTLSRVQSLTLDQPKHGSRSARINVAGDTVYTLPFIAQLAAGSSLDAASSTNTTLAAAEDETAAMPVHLDLPCFQAPSDPDVRITIKASAETGDSLIVNFAFLDRSFKDVYFRSYDVNSTASHQQFFPSEGRLRGVVIASHASNVIDVRNREVTQISLNGEQRSTFTEPNILGANYDQAVFGGAKDAATKLDVYALLENFPGLTSGVSHYVQIDRSAASEMYIVGVMSDA
jgi:hypothetical protein